MRPDNEERRAAFDWAMEHYGPEQVWADGEHDSEQAVVWCVARYREYHSPEAAQKRVEEARRTQVIAARGAEHAATLRGRFNGDK